MKKKKNIHTTASKPLSRKIIINIPEQICQENNPDIYLDHNGQQIQIRKESTATQNTNLNNKNEFMAFKTGKSVLAEEFAVVGKKQFRFVCHDNVVELPTNALRHKEIAPRIDQTSTSNSSRKKIKKLNKELTKYRIILKNIMTNIPGNIYWKDKCGKYLGCNEQQAKNLGLQKSSEVINKKDSDLIKNNRIATNIKHTDLLAMRTEKPTIVEEQITEEKNSAAMVHKFPFRDLNGKIIGVMGISLDIQKEKQSTYKIEQISKLLEKRRKLLGNVSHEIRIPLQGIECILQEVVSQWNSLPDKKKFSLVKKVANNSNRLMASASNLLDLSRIDFENFNLNKKKSDLNLIVINTIKEFSNAYNSTKIYLEIGKKFHPEINIDPLRITQVIRSLLNNALQHENESITVKLENFYIKEPALPDSITPAIKFSVIYEESKAIEKAQNKNSNPFKNLKEDSNKKQNNGNGEKLGLSICKEIIDFHGGEIWMKNNKTGGQTFSFVIPKTNEREEISKTTMPCRTKTIMRRQDAKHLNILYVDDEDACITSANLVLPSLKHNLTTASNGVEALEKLKEGYKKFDLILLDIMMPQMNGLEALKKIKSHPKYKDIPVFMQSGMSDGLTLKEAIALGANREFLQKPFTRKDMVNFLNVINKYCNKNNSSIDNNLISLQELHWNTNEPDLEKFATEELTLNN